MFDNLDTFPDLQEVSRHTQQDIPDLLLSALI